MNPAREPSPSGLIDGNQRRAIDLCEGDGIAEKAFKAPIRAAANLDVAARAKKKPKGA